MTHLIAKAGFPKYAKLLGNRFPKKHELKEVNQSKINQVGIKV